MDCWEMLGLEPTSDKKAIKRQYAKLLKLNRPDDDEQAFQRLREAYEHALEVSNYIDNDSYEDEATANDEYIEETDNNNDSFASNSTEEDINQNLSTDAENEKERIQSVLAHYYGDDDETSKNNLTEETLAKEERQPDVQEVIAQDISTNTEKNDGQTASACYEEKDLEQLILDIERLDSWENPSLQTDNYVFNHIDAVQYSESPSDDAEKVHEENLLPETVTSETLEQILPEIEQSDKLEVFDLQLLQYCCKNIEASERHTICCWANENLGWFTLDALHSPDEISELFYLLVSDVTEHIQKLLNPTTSPQDKVIHQRTREHNTVTYLKHMIEAPWFQSIARKTVLSNEIAFHLSEIPNWGQTFFTQVRDIMDWQDDILSIRNIPYWEELVARRNQMDVKSTPQASEEKSSGLPNWVIWFIIIAALRGCFKLIQ